MAKKLPIFGIGIASVLTVFTVISTVSVIGAMNEIDETNKFISDNIQIPIEYIDETSLKPADEGVYSLKFEAEHAKFVGVSSSGATNLDHACAGKSYKFGEEFSGGAALTNIFSSPSLDNANKLVFTVNSDKNVKVNGIIRCGGSTSSSFTSFGITDLFQIKINNRTIRLTGNLPLSTDKKLVTVPISLSLTEGQNDITISTKPYTSIVTGDIDYMEFYTTANITGYEKQSWDMSNYKITLPPMSARLGKAEYICDKCGSTYKVDSLPSIDAGLENGIYEKIEKEENGDKITEYYFANSDKLVSSDPLPKTIQHKLTIQSDYVTFEDGSKEASVWEFYEFPEVVDTLDGRKVSGWYNVKNKSEQWTSNEFWMPTYDVTVAPIFDADNYKQDLEVEEHNKYNEGKPKEEWSNSPLYGSFNGKIQLNDRSVSYKPIHSSSTATVGFSQGKLASSVTETIIFDKNTYDEYGTIFAYDGVKKDWSFLTCASCNLSSDYPKTFKVKMNNQGTSTLSFDFWFATASSNPTGNGNNPHKSGIVLNPNETINFELDVKFSNSNIMSYFKFNEDAAQMKLAMTWYTENVSTAPEHNVVIKNIPNTNYTVQFNNGTTAKVKEGKSLPELIVNAPEDHILDGFFVNDDKENIIGPSGFIMGKEDVTLTPIFRYKTGEKVDLTDSGGNGKSYIFSSADKGLSGFTASKLSNNMVNELVLKGTGNNLYYETATLFKYEGGLSNTAIENYSFLHMAALNVSGKYRIAFNLKNDGTEALKFTLTQTNRSGDYANSAVSPSTDMIELNPGECKTVFIETPRFGNASVLTYYKFYCHTNSDMRLYVTEYFTKI